MKFQIMLCAALVLGSIHQGFADTMVGGFITTDTHWMAGDGPFIVNRSILVTNNASLTIDPGTEVRFGPDLGIVVDSGTLIAQGTESNQIRFTADVPNLNTLSDVDRWSSLRFNNGAVDAVFDASDNYVSGSIIEYAIVEGAGGTPLLGAIRADSSAPFLSRSTIENNANTGIVADRSDNIRIVGNTIKDNSRFGIVLTLTSNTVVSDNVISGSESGMAIQSGLRTNILNNTFSRHSDTGLRLEGGDDNVVSNNLITGNEINGIDVQWETGAALSGNTIAGNTSADPSHGRGLYIFDSEITLTNDQIRNNSGHGVVIEQGDHMIVLSDDPLHPTIIFDNGGSEVFNMSAFRGGTSADDPGNVDARNVFWGTTDIAQVEAGIHDFFDDSSKGIVFFDPIVVPELGTLIMLIPVGLFILARRTSTTSF